MVGHAAAMTDARATLGFADSLVSEKFFNEALIEYKRALSLSPDLKKDPFVMEKYLMASLLGTTPLQALENVRSLIQSDITPEVSCVAKYFEGRVLYDLANYKQALVSFKHVQSFCGDPWKGHASYWAGLTSLWTEDWKNSLSDFSTIPLTSVWYVNAQRGMIRAQNGPRIHWKSEGKAAGLNAILPGTGYWYAGSPQTGVASFITTGLFGWGTVASIRSGNSGAAAVLGLFSLAWYFGGIYGAGAAANRYNFFIKKGWTNLDND